MSAAYRMRHIVKLPIGSPAIVDDDAAIIGKDAHGFYAFITTLFTHCHIGIVSV